MKRSGKFYRRNEEEVMESTGRKIIFIWEHEINDDWFWIGDFIEEVMQNA